MICNITKIIINLFLALKNSLKKCVGQQEIREEAITRSKYLFQAESSSVRGELHHNKILAGNDHQKYGFITAAYDDNAGIYSWIKKEDMRNTLRRVTKQYNHNTQDVPPSLD